MRNAVVGAALVATLCLVPRSHAADDATLLRVFLKDGTSLVSYGEPARVGDRVVFSMPTAATSIRYGRPAMECSKRCTA